MNKKKIGIFILGLLFILVPLCMYIFLIEHEDKVALTSDMISKVQYLETDSVAEGMITDGGQEARDVFQKLISSKKVVTQKEFFKKRFFEQSSHRKIDFVLDDGKKITFNVVLFNVEPYYAEAYVQCVGNKTIYHLNKEDATDIGMQFMNR
ncbi:hypothetical protein [Bacillus sp. BP-3]|uniref:hypothetical protein n=1 Tax=Bacillus sp. BP-3 TaxID=3022773 RepID=UPI00232E7CE5|nr:hypothetical protein [Bacillus sp. BP-3]MDC2865084.1 hypothetical protein [Bacillus sp. BP-3]